MLKHVLGAVIMHLQMPWLFHEDATATGKRQHINWSANPVPRTGLVNKTKFRQSLDQIYTKFRQNLDQVQTKFRPSLDQVWTKFRLS